ncbi:insulinase family protein [bacterium]|nr:insulinase family protein [bacterium]
MTTKYQLKNGLNVILVKSEKSPVVSVQMWVKTGGADEEKPVQGISHFIEHLVFKGTKSFGVGEIASTIEGSGGELNAYTSFDQTVFYVNISKDFKNIALKAIGEMMSEPLFDKDEVDNEREVVVEEIKRSIDNPHRQVSEMLFSTIYKKHGYGKPILGYEKIIYNLPVKKINEYFNSRYVPSNMTLVVAGDFETADMKKEIKKYYDGFEPFKLKKVKRVKEPKQIKSRVNVKNKEFNENIFYMAWNTPKITHKDIPALDILALIFGQGESSRLNTSLVIEKAVAQYAGASCYTPIDPGFFAVSAQILDEKLEDFLDGLREQLLEICSTQIRKEELAKAIINYESDEYYGLETVEGLAKRVGTYQHLFNDHKYSAKFLKAIKKVTPEDLLRVAKKYLKPDNLTAIYLTSGDEDKGKKIVKKFITKYKKDLAKKKKVSAGNEKSEKLLKIKTPKYNKKHNNQIIYKKLDNGATVILRPNYDTPVVSFRAAFLGGIRAEQSEQLGLSSLTSKVWATETKLTSENELNKKLDNMASGLSSFGGRNTMGLSASTLSGFSHQVRDLFFECLLEPKFSPEIINREQINMVEQLKRREDNLTQRALLKLMENMFKDHPYGRDPLGSENKIKSYSEKDLESYFNPIIHSDNFHFCASGAFDPEEWLSYIEDRTKEFTKNGYKDEIREHLKIAESQKYFEQEDKEQSHIAIGFNGYTFTSHHIPALEVMNAILSGQGGRLFLELRDKASLAYTVSPIKMEGIDGGYFGAYIGCSPEKAKKAIKMLNEEFSKLANKKIDNHELDRAKRYLIGQNHLGLQKNSSIAAAMLFDDVYNVGYDSCFKYSDKINKVTSEDVQNLAKEIFSGNEIISVIGKENPF